MNIYKIDSTAFYYNPKRKGYVTIIKQERAGTESINIKMSQLLAFAKKVNDEMSAEAYDEGRQLPLDSE